MQEFRVGPDEAGLRADVILASKYPAFSRSALEALFDEQLIKLEDKSIKPSHRPKTGQQIMVDETLLRTEPPKINLPVIYEDKEIIVIDKPAGALTHSKGALNTEATVASFIKDKLNDAKLTGNRAGIVHRLDRGTSGVIVAAKNTIALQKLQRQFSTRKVKKTYLAIVEGTPKPEEAVIDAPIARNPNKPQTFYVNSSGKPAQTQYKLVKSFQKNQKQYSVLELRPLSGRTHQIRIHMAYIGCPVVGDYIYGRAGPHLLLHAAELELNLPSGDKKIFKAPTPDYFKEFGGL